MIRYEKIVTHLRTIPTISAIAPGGIFDRLQWSKTENYLIVNLVSDNPLTISDNNSTQLRLARLEFRFIGWTAQTSTTQILDMVDVVDSEITNKPCTPIFNYDGFSVTAVSGQTVTGLRIEPSLWLPVIIKDYLFTYFE
jgi:hypothetical protein